jgi:hypothetical protein
LHTLTEIELESSLHKDSERNSQLELSRAVRMGETRATLTFGARSSRREKTNTLTVWKFKTWATRRCH